jgi:hypothetical protein
MQLKHPRVGPRRTIAVLAAAGALVAAPGASAADPSVTIAAGSATAAFTTAPEVGAFPGVTLNGLAQVVNAKFGGGGTTNTWEINDTRGTAAGWHVTAEATQFALGTDATKKLPLNSLALNAPTVAASGTNAATPPSVGSGPFTLDGGVAVTIAGAAAGAGEGAWTFTNANASEAADSIGTGDVHLVVPANARVGTYSSTLTVSVNQTP